MREKLTVLNAFVHDVATGTWIASLIVATIFELEHREPAWAGMTVHVEELERKFMVLTWVSLGVILLTGVFRMLTFKVFGWTGDVAKDRIRILKIKHALLGAVFACGTAWQTVLLLG
jgi:uncharacterized membrane protein